ncbi:hypothetical protein A4D02_14465 [Niastella koreensis]|uniref:Uncharacterized protein n=2 Tax=Niastella koreensis TaxID=354356 RepID=G8T9A2_NIAKG|nr:hypothetical protein [Niastella koreensis]AEV98070.1 hypothetical protein Niako_1706 [Niastella koreensis GR20-10]OQP40133.1 hypothetical protein A4D02_14465 [Niastella koreensis]
MKKKIFHYLSILLACCLLQPASGQCVLGALSKELLDPNTTQEFKNFIKNNPEGMNAYGKYLVNPYLRKDVDVLTATADFMTNHPDYLRDFPGKFDDILENLKRAGARCNICPPGGNKGIPPMHQAISDLDWAWATFKDGNVDVHKLFTEMAASYQKADGGAYMISVLRTNALQDQNYVRSITSFEYQFLEDGRFEADLYRVVNGKNYLSEFKSFSRSSWEAFSSDTKKVNQFLAYFSSGDNFEYIANISKLSAEVNPATFVRTQFMKIFDAKARELLSARPTFFTKIKYGNQTIDIESVEELRNLCKNADFAESSLFNFVKPL